MIRNTCPNPGTPSPVAALPAAGDAAAAADRTIIPPTVTARPRIFSVRTACIVCLPHQRDPTTVGPQPHGGQDCPPGQPPPGMGMLVRGCLTGRPKRPTAGPAATARPIITSPGMINAIPA